MFSLGNGTVADGAQLSCLCSSVIIGEMFKAGGTFHSEGLPSMFVFGRLSVSLNKKETFKLNTTFLKQRLENSRKKFGQQ